MKAKLMPSGNWNVKVLDYIDERGKKHIRSFTAPTKEQAELLGAQFKANRTEGGKDGSVADMIERSIREKASVLSPSTLRGYNKIYDNMVEPSRFGRLRVSTLSNQQVQQWISWMVGQGYSPKSIKNAVGVFTSCYRYHGGERLFRVKLPQASARRRRVPSIADVKMVINYFADDEIMTNAIRLGAILGLLRGEICALTAADINRKVCSIRVNKAVTETADRKWIIKAPKTASSVRVVPAFPELIAGLPKSGNVVPVNPDVITNRFCRAIRALPVIPFSFHDLRHFSASLLHNRGAADITIQSILGWSSPGVMKEVYWNEIEEETQRQMKNFFDFVRAVFNFK